MTRAESITNQTVAIMAAAIYAAKRGANPYRARLTTLRKESVREARALLDEVLNDEGRPTP